MRATILTFGSRGDVQPLVALGRGLARAGHDVRVLTDRAFESLVTDQELEFAPMSGDMKTIFAGHQNPLLQHGDNPIAFVRVLLDQLRSLIPVWFDECLAASRDADVMLSAGGTVCMAGTIREKYGTPFVRALVQPLSPTREFPSALMPRPPFRLPGFVNHLSHAMVNWLFWMAFRGGTNEARRKEFDLRPWPLRGPWTLFERDDIPALYGFSPVIVPPPEDWPGHHFVTGYWFLDDERWEPPDDLVAFLDRGEAPIYVGFGSMAIRDPQETTTIVLDALERSGQRAVLATGWGGLQRQALPDHVHLIEGAPHNWLLPRVRVAVHHGGAGTTAAAARAGIPSVIVPFIADQPFWAERIHGLGAGPPPLPRRRIDAEGLAAAIRCAAEDPRIRGSAADLGERIRAEAGVQRAVSVVERYVGA